MNSNATPSPAPFIAVMIGADPDGQAIVNLSYREGSPVIGEATTDAVMKLLAAVESICEDERVHLIAVGLETKPVIDESPEPRKSEPAKAAPRKKRVKPS